MSKIHRLSSLTLEYVHDVDVLSQFILVFSLQLKNFSLLTDVKAQYNTRQFSDPLFQLEIKT